MIFWNFEFEKNKQFLITDYSKTIWRSRKIPNNKRLLIVWTFHKNMNKKLFLLLKLQILKMLWRKYDFLKVGLYGLWIIRTKNFSQCVRKVVYNFWSRPIHSFRNVRIYKERWSDLSRFIRHAHEVSAFKCTKWLVFPRLPIPFWVFLSRFYK